MSVLRHAAPLTARRQRPSLALRLLSTVGAGALLLQGAARADQLIQTPTPASTISDPGTLTFDGGTLQADAPGLSLANAVLVNPTGGSIDTAGQPLMTLSGTIGDGAGPGMLAKLGAGTLVLSGLNTYSGGTLLAGGTVRITNSAGDLSSSSIGTGTLTFGSGTFQLGADGLSIANAVAVNAAGGTIDTSHKTATFTGVIANGDAGTGSLAITGGGAVTLAGANTYSGGTSVAGTTLVVTNSTGDLAGSTSIGFGALTLDGGTLKSGTDGLAFANALRIGASGATVDTGGNTLTLAGTIADAVAGAGALSKTGTGTLALSGTNGFTGGTRITQGTMLLQNSQALGTGGVVLAGGGLAAGTSGLTLANAVTVGAGGGTIDSFGQTVTLSGAIGSAAGAGPLTIGDSAGGGVVVLSGTNTMSGPTALVAGTLKAGSAGGFSPNSMMSVAAGAILDINGQAASVGGLQDGAFGGGEVTNGSASRNATLTLGGAGGTASFSGLIDDGTQGRTLALVKTGSGVQTLATYNPYSGGTTVAAGTLRLGAFGAVGVGGLTLSGGTLDLNGFAETAPTLAGSAGTITNTGSGTAVLSVQSGSYAGQLADGHGTLALVKQADTSASGGTLTLSGSNTFSGGVTLSGGTLAVGSNGALGTGPLSMQYGTLTPTQSGLSLANAISLDGAGTLDLAGRGLGLGGTITGPGGLSVASTGGASTLALDGANTFAGGLTFGPGVTVRVSRSSQGPAGAVTASPLGGGLVIADGGTLQATGNLTLGNVLLINTGGLTIDTGANSLAYTGFVGDGNGAGALVKAGSGTLTLTSPNGYSGGTRLAAGTLAIGDGGSLGGGTLTFAGGTLQAAGDNLFLGNPVSMAAAGTIDTAGRTVTALGTIDGSGALTVASSTGRGTLVLVGTNTYSGGTILKSGIAQVINVGAVAGAPSSLGTGAVAFDGGTLQAGVDGLTILNSAAVRSGGGTIDTNGLTLTYGGAIADAGSGAGALTKTGAGTLALGRANSFSGGIGIAQGTLSVGHSQALGTGTVTFAGGTLQAGADGLVLANAGAMGTAGGTVDTNAVTLTLSGAIAGGTGTGPLTIADATGAGIGRLVLAGNSTFSGGTILASGTAEARNSGAFGTGAITFAGGTLAAGADNLTLANGIRIGTAGALVDTASHALTLAGTIADAAGAHGALTKTGAGTLVLTGTNTVSGGITLSSGILAVGSNAALGTGALSLDGGTLRAQAGGLTLANAVTVDGLGGTIDVAGKALTLSGVLADSPAAGIGPLTVQSSGGAGSLVLSGANTMSGGLTVSSGVTLVAGRSTVMSGGVIQSSALGSGLVTFDGATLQAGAAGVTLANAALVNGGGLTIDTNGQALTYSGWIGDGTAPGTLTKVGAGALTLGTANAYSGGTVLKAGTLSILDSAALGGGTLTLAGGTLAAGADNLVLGNAVAIATQGTIDTAGRTLVYVGQTGGAGTLVKAGAGTLVMAGSLANTGGVTVNGGTLQAGTVFAPTTAVTVNSGATFDLAGIDQSLAGLAGSGTVTSGAGPATLTYAGSGTATFAGHLVDGSAAAPLGLTIGGSGTLVLTGTASYSGATTIDSGTLQAGAAHALSTASLVNLTGTLDIAGHDQTIPGLAGTGRVVSSGGAGTLTVSSAGFSLFNGTFADGSGTLGLTVAGGGTLMLAGNASHSGATTVTAGSTLLLGAANALSAHSATAVAGTLDLAGWDAAVGTLAGAGVVQNSGGVATLSTDGGAAAFTGSLRDAGGQLALTKTGPGTLVLAGSNSYSGMTLVAGGTLRAGAVNTFSANSIHTVDATLDLAGFDETIMGLAGTGAVTNSAAAGATLTLGGAVTTSFSGQLADGAGPLGLALTGGGTLQLAASQTYSGATLVTAGTLQGAAVNVFSTRSALLVDAAGTLDMGGFDQGVGRISGTGIITNAGSRDATLTLGDSGTNRFDGTITDGPTNALRLVKAGAGTLTLGGIGSYSGGTRISAGTLAVVQSGALGNGAVTFAGGTLKAAADGLTIGNAAVLSAAGTIDTGGYTLTYGGTIAGSGDLSIGGGGIAVLAGTATNIGATQVLAGTQVLAASAGAFSSASAFSVAGTLDLGGFSQTIGSLSGAGIVQSSAGAAVLSVDGAPGTAFSGVLQDGPGGTLGLAKVGPGTLVLSSANTYSGGTRVNDGTLRLAASTVLSGGAIQSSAIGTGTLTLAGGTVQAGQAGLTIANDTSLAGTGTIDTNGFDVTVTGAVSGPGSLTKVGGGTLILDALSTYSGGTVLSAGRVVVTQAAADFSASSVGTGTLALRGGSLAAGADNLALGNAVTIEGATSAIDTNGHALTLAGGIADGSRPGTLVKQGAGTLTLAAAGTYTGGTTLSAGILAVAADQALGTGTLSFAGGSLQAIGGVSLANALTIGAPGASIDTGPGTLTLSGAIGEASGVAGSLTKQGTGTLLLTGASSYSGTTDVAAGTLAAGAAGAFSARSGFSVAGTLDIGGFDQTIGALSGTGSVTNAGAQAATLTTDGAAAAPFSGHIGDGTSALALVKTGPGTLVLSGINDYTGGTTIAGGTLLFSRPEAVAGGTGSILVQRGGVAAAGFALDNTTLARIAAASAGVVALAADSAADLDLAAANLAGMSLGASGSATYSGTLTPAGGLYRLGGGGGTLTVSSSLTGAASLLVSGNGTSPGTIVLTGTNDLTGTVTVADGTLRIASGGSVTQASALDNGGTVDILSGGAVTAGTITNRVGGTLTSAGALTATTLTNAGSLSLAGTVQIGNIANSGSILLTGALGGTIGTYVQTAGTFDLGGRSLAVDNVTVLGGSVVNGTLSSRNQTYASGTISADLTGPSGVRKIGSGVVTLSGHNTYAGDTTVEGGTLVVGNGSALGTGTLRLASGTTLGFGAGGLVLGNAVVLSGATAPIIDTGVVNETLAGTIGGTGGLTKRGSGALTFTGANSYSGNTWIQQGSVLVGSAGALGSGGILMDEGTRLGFRVDGASFANAITFTGQTDPVIDTGANTVTLSGVIGGPGSMSKLGTGTLILTGANTYSGGTEIDAGALVLGSTSAVGTGGVTIAGGALRAGLDTTLANALTVTGAGTIDTQAFNLAASGVLSGSGNLTKVGSGTLTLSAAATLSGRVGIAAGTIALTGAGSLARASDVAVAGTLDLTQATGPALASLSGGGSVLLGDRTLKLTAAQGTFSGTISGPGGLLLTGGTETLSGTNGFAGGLEIRGGTLAFTGAAALGTGALTLSGGTLQAAADGIVVGQAGQITAASTIDTQGFGLTYAGSLTGAGGLTKAGSGTLYLSGSNSYTGGTTIGGGTVEIGSADAIGKGTLTLAGGALRAGTAGLSLANAVVLQSAGTVDSGTGSLTLSGAISGAGAFVKAGTGTLTLTGAASYTGLTRVAAGTLVLAPGVSLASSSGALVEGTLDLSSAGNSRLASLAGSGRVTLGASMLTLTSAGGTFAGTLTGTGGLVLAAGTERLTGTSTFSGGVTVAGGTLAIASSAALGTGSLTLVGGTLQAAADGVSLDRAIALAADSAIDTQGFTLTASGPIGGAGGLTKQGDGTLVLATSNSYAGDTLVQGGTLAIAASSALGSGAVQIGDGTRLAFAADGLTLANTVRIAGGARATVDSGTGTATLAGAIAGGGTLVKAGDGTLLLTQRSTYAGGTQVTSGTLAIGTTGALGTGTLRMDDGTRLAFAASGVTLGNAVQMTGAGGFSVDSGTGTATIAGSIAGTGALTKIGIGSLILAQANGYTGGTVLRAGTIAAGVSGALGTGTVQMADATTLVFGDGVTLANALRMSGTRGVTLDSGSGTAQLGGTITGTGALTKAGAGTLTLTRSSSYSGDTLLTAGTLAIGARGALGTGTLRMEDGTRLAFAADALTLDNAVVLNGSGTATVDSGGGSATLAGAIGGTGGLTKAGNGTLTLSGTSGYTGATLVSAGTLNVTGSIGQSAVTVSSGAVLGGTGTVGALTAGSGATVLPGGASPFGTLTVTRDAAFGSGSVLRIGLDPSGNTSRLAVGGTATLAGGVVDVVAGAGIYDPATTYTILQAGRVAGHFASLTTTTDLAFLTPTLSYGQTSVSLGFSRATTASGQDVPFSSVASTSTQTSTADAIQAIGKGNALYGAVLSQSAEGARAALDAASGEVHASATTAAVEDQTAVRDAMIKRLQDAEAVPLAAPEALAAIVPPPPVPGAARSYAPAAAPIAPIVPYTVWGQGFGGFGSNGRTEAAATMDRSVGGFILGGDMPVTGVLGTDWRVGIAGGYINDSISVADRQSRGTVETIFGAAYAGARYGAVDVKLGTAFGGLSNAIRRSVVFPGFNESERADIGGLMVQGFGEVGYRMALAGTTIEPIFNGAVVHLRQDAFTEKGGAAALVSGARSTDVGMTTVGVRAETALWTGVPLVARGLLGWRAAFGDIDPTARLGFAAGSPTFLVSGVPIDRHALAAEAWLDWRASSMLSLGVSYAGQVGAKAQDHSFKGSFEVKF